MRWLRRELSAIRASEPETDPLAPRRGEPRTFIALWAAYLFGVTIVTIGMAGAGGLLSSEVYRPAARVMLEAAAFGIVLAWPLIRLSQEAPANPCRAFLLDALIVALPVQIFAGVQCLPWMADWPRDVVGLLGGMLGAWALIVGGLLAITFAGGRSAPIPRWAMMGLLVLITFAGPAMNVLDIRRLDRPEADACNAWMLTSPLSAVFEITRDRPWTGAVAAITPGHKAAFFITLGVAGLIWTLAGVRSLAGRDGQGATEGLD